MPVVARPVASAEHLQLQALCIHRVGNAAELTPLCEVGEVALEEVTAVAVAAPQETIFGIGHNLCTVTDETVVLAEEANTLQTAPLPVGVGGTAARADGGVIKGRNVVGHCKEGKEREGRKGSLMAWGGHTSKHRACPRFNFFRRTPSALSVEPSALQPATQSA